MKTFQKRRRMSTMSQHVWIRLTCLLAMAGMSLWSGCSRTFWRNKADESSYAAIAEHITDPRWEIPRFDVTPDPRSRYFDPYDPDAAPLPPDDQAANAYMHWVDGWEGYRCWHKFGVSMTVENPQWLANFGLTPEMVDPISGHILAPVPSIENVTLREALELQQIHDRDYQTQIENVYIAALDVAFERFQFGIRYLTAGGREPNANSTTTFVPHGPGDRSNLSTQLGVSQLLPAGAQWALELTNNTLWLFSGGQTNSASVLSYSLTQPLLANAGRKIGLEGLTLAERNLLYQIRLLARFRKVNFAGLVGGGNGFLGLMQQLQSVRNEEGNIGRLSEQVERLLSESQRNQRYANVALEALPPGLEFPPGLNGQLEFRDDLQRLLWRGPMSSEQAEILRNLSQDPGFQAAANNMIKGLRTEVAGLDVLQLQSDLQDSKNRLRILETDLQGSLDSFKLLLGLPPDMNVSVSDQLLEPFEIIDRRIIELEERTKDFKRSLAVLQETDLSPEDLSRVITDFEQLVDTVETGGMELLSEDGAKVKAILPSRLEELRTDEFREQLRSDIERADFLFEEAKTNLAGIRQAAEQYSRTIEMGNLDEEGRIEVFRGIDYLREDLLKLIQGMSVIQVSYRIELIELNDFDIPIQDAVAIGIENRLDLMNTRAVVMDARRAVEIAANRLKSQLDVVVEGDFRNSGGNKPFDFRGERSEIRAGVQFTTPLDQIDESNIYRRTLINYQRAKRDYMEAEDSMKAAVRNSWRNLYGARSSLEISRRSVRLAALQYDSAVVESSKPKDPRQAVTSSSGLEGRNLTQALSSILRAQNQLIGFWINYERNRINIYRDMGIMDIGPDGVWEDTFYRKLTNEADTTSSDDVPSETPYEPEPEIDGDTAEQWEGPVLGRRTPGAGGRSRLVERSDGGFGEDTARIQLIQADSRQPDYAGGVQSAVFDQPVGTGKPGQSEELHPELSGRGINHNHQSDSRGNAGESGGHRLRTGFVSLAGEGETAGDHRDAGRVSIGSSSRGSGDSKEAE